MANLDLKALLAHIVGDMGVKVIASESFSSLPLTITNSSIKSTDVVVNHILSVPSAQGSDWTVTTQDGSLQINGTFSGTTATTITLYLEHGK